jgi:hypothetical protein
MDPARIGGRSQPFYARTSRRRGRTGVLQDGAGAGARKSCRSSLLRSRVREYGTGEGRARRDRHVCAHGSGDSARAPHARSCAHASGRTEEAIGEFLKTKELEETYYRTEKIPARYDWHHAHNLTLLAMSYQTLGQMKSAEALFHETFTSPAYTDFLEYNRKCWPEFLLSRGRFQEALDAARELTKSEWPLPRLAGHTLAERETERLPPGAIAALPTPRCFGPTS